MKIAIATLASISPYSQSRAHATPHKEKELEDAYDKRTWPEHCHTDATGHIFVPAMAFSNCIKEASRFLSIQVPGKGKSTWTKHFEAGIQVVDSLILPIKKTDVESETLYLNSDGRVGGGRRVWRTYPLIPKWGGDVQFYIFDDLITEEIFTHVLKQAGQLIGIGRFRPKNRGYYGRFVVNGVKWQDESGKKVA